MKATQTTTFSAWIRVQGINALARKLGVDPTAVSKWANGKSQPNLEHAAQILSMARGKLKAADLMKPEVQA